MARRGQADSWSRGLRAQGQRGSGDAVRVRRAVSPSEIVECVAGGRVAVARRCISVYRPNAASLVTVAVHEHPPLAASVQVAVA